jgi:hypothetical protein
VERGLSPRPVRTQAGLLTSAALQKGGCHLNEKDCAPNSTQQEHRVSGDWSWFRTPLVSLAAALFACPLASLLLFGEVGDGVFLPFPFTLMGSLLLLATGYGAAREAQLPESTRYLRLVIIGAVAGALMLGVGGVLSQTYPFLLAGIGAAYGLTTAVCWIALHLVLGKLLPEGW